MRDILGNVIRYYDDCYYNSEQMLYLSEESSYEIYRDLGCRKKHGIVLKFLTESETEYLSELWGKDEIEPEELMEKLGYSKVCYMSEGG